MLRIAIVDDESEARRRLRNIVNITMINHKVDYKVEEFQSGSELFKEDIDTFDIIFLDIEMNDENGIEVSKELKKKEFSSIIIFVTSFDAYVRNAFGLNVYAYIMKDEIDVVVPRTLISLLKDMDKKTYIVLHGDQGPLTMKFVDILYFIIEERKIYIHTYNDKIRVYGTSLKKLSVNLNESFLYPNSKYILNASHIKSIENGAIILDNDECIFISKGKFKRFNEEYKNFLIKENAS